ncbi:MAG: sugar phosphate isomerase/epimerase [Clostridia bacterium]|nr:sugar phosphate isomerase/epimerase [Clostridia bacterium]
MKKIGILIRYENELQEKQNFRERFEEAQAMGIDCCQLCFPEGVGYTEEVAEKINAAVLSTGFEISLLWAGWTGANDPVWNFTKGPTHLGIVPMAYRAQRVKQLQEASEFALKIGVKDIATHVGFIPENMTDPAYVPLVEELKELCALYASRDQNFLFETGQETPVTLLRTIEKIGLNNAFINFDTANLILYGKGNSVDAVRVFGKYVRNTHIKDGVYPTDGMSLGREVKVGEGLANFPALIAILDEAGYEGPYTIEREIAGEAQKKDIRETVVYLRELFKKIEEKK